MVNNATLQVTHVTKNYGADATHVQAVRDVSLEVKPEEVVLIMGPSGSGKTTLLQMMGALLKPTDGSIQLNGEMLSALAENRLPTIRLHQIGFIFQNFNLLSALTVLDNVALVAELAGLKRREARKKAATMATDPVCGMKVEREKAVTTEWQGQPFSFCSRGCRNEFLEEPQQFLNTVFQ